MNSGFSLKIEEKVLIWDKFIVFRDFGTWYLISGQSRKIWDSWFELHLVLIIRIYFDKNLI